MDHQGLPHHGGGHGEGDAPPHHKGAALDFPQIGQQQHGQGDGHRVGGEEDGGQHQREGGFPAPGHEPAAQADVPVQVGGPEQPLAEAVRPGVAVDKKQIVGEQHGQAGADQRQRQAGPQYLLPALPPPGAAAERRQGFGHGDFLFSVEFSAIILQQNPRRKQPRRKKAPHRGCGAGKVQPLASLRLAISACSAGRFFSTVQNSTSTAQTR